MSAELPDQSGRVSSHEYPGLVAPCEGDGCRFCEYDARAQADPPEDGWWPRVMAAYKALTEQAPCWETEFADGNVGIVLGAMDAAVVVVRLMDAEASR